MPIYITTLVWLIIANITSVDLTSETWVESITAKTWCNRCDRSWTHRKTRRRIRTTARTAFSGALLTHPRRVIAALAVGGPSPALVIITVCVGAAFASSRTTKNISSADNATRCHTVLDHPSLVFLALVVFGPRITLIEIRRLVRYTEIACFFIGRTFRDSKGVPAVADRTARARTVSQHPFRVGITLGRSG